jgi:hypothetical protein
MRRGSAFAIALLFGTMSATVTAGAAARAAAGGVGPLPAVAANPTWGAAKQPRGMSQLDHGGDGILNSVSCPAKGTCSAVGYYDDAGTGRQVFTLGEEGGAWGLAQAVPSVATLNTGHSAELTTVSCASAGNCGGGGHYKDVLGTVHSFVVTEAGGTWTGAKEVPGSLPAGERASQVSTESCPAVGRCTIAGYLTDSGGGNVVYVDSQTPNHAWGTALPVPGLPAAGFIDLVNSLYCLSPGNCAVGGYMRDLTSGVATAWIASEVNGLWLPARKLAVALNKGGEGRTMQVSCGSPGNCAVVGFFSPGGTDLTPFIEVEKNGAWQPPIVLSGLGKQAVLNAVSCASAGNCTAGGAAGKIGFFHAIVVTEKNGKWGKPASLPGMAAIDTGHLSADSALACVSPGNCAAAGIYNSASNPSQLVWVAGQRGGVWGNAAPVPNLITLIVGHNTHVNGLSCATLGSCAMVGDYTDGAMKSQPWVASGAIAVPTTVRLALSTGTVRVGHEQAEKVSVSVTAANGRRPPGKVTIKAGSATLCVITLTSGTGSCRLGASQLRPGSYTVAAVYDGSHDYQGSNVAKKPLRVTT